MRGADRVPIPGPSLGGEAVGAFAVDGRSREAAGVLHRRDFRWGGSLVVGVRRRESPRDVRRGSRRRVDLVEGRRTCQMEGGRTHTEDGHRGVARREVLRSEDGRMVGLLLRMGNRHMEDGRRRADLRSEVGRSRKP